METEVASAEAHSSADSPERQAVNPFAFGLPLLLMGALLALLFPPIGFVFLTLGVVLCTVGLGIAAFRAIRSRLAGDSAAEEDADSHEQNP